MRGEGPAGDPAERLLSSHPTFALTLAMGCGDDLREGSGALRVGCDFSAKITDPGSQRLARSRAAVKQP